MANIPPRWDKSGQWYFVSVVTKKRALIFQSQKNCALLQKSFKEVHNYYPFRLGALSILPDHWHGLIRTDYNSVIEDIVGNIKRNLNRYLKIKESIWQERFLDHRIRSEDDFYFHGEYIRNNAFKHGLAKENEDYQYCFIHINPFGN